MHAFILCSTNKQKKQVQIKKMKLQKLHDKLNAPFPVS